MIRLIFTILLTGLTTVALAKPTQAVHDKVMQQVVKIKVALNNGNDSNGSGVVIAENRIVTNCHVVANASKIKVLVGKQSYTAQSITPDWHHDICLVTVQGLKAPIATIGNTDKLDYQQPVFAVGYPKTATKAVTTYGAVKGLLAMDDSVVVRASSTFKRGESGGGLFDDAGNLVGVITLKSPGNKTYYYNMPVAWVQSLIDQPEQSINSQSETAFWAKKSDQWPFFMKVVRPYLQQDWQSVKTVASNWTQQEPNNVEAWFYLAAAEYGMHDLKIQKSICKK